MMRYVPRQGERRNTAVKETRSAGGSREKKMTTVILIEQEMTILVMYVASNGD